MRPTLRLGISPCPNDTFIFYDIVQGYQERDYFIDVEYHDIETLNRLALDGYFDIVKISYALLEKILPHYILLRSGGALGYGVGPLLIANQPKSLFEGAKVISPGNLTTAQMLFNRYANDCKIELETRPFEQIMPALVNSEADFGIIIHESRFTYTKYNLHLIQDLGAWWEATTKTPIPLGGIVAKRNLAPQLLKQLQIDIRQSLLAAMRNTGETLMFCKQHAQEIDEQVMLQHIQLYVNDFSYDLNIDGENAIKQILNIDDNSSVATNAIWLAP